MTVPLFGEPWAAGVGVSASLLRDPLIVDAGLNYHYTAAQAKLSALQSVAANLGVGFAVNESFTLRGDVTQMWTIGQIVLPSTD